MNWVIVFCGSWLMVRTAEAILTSELRDGKAQGIGCERPGTPRTPLGRGENTSEWQVHRGIMGTPQFWKPQSQWQLAAASSGWPTM